VTNPYRSSLCVCVSVRRIDDGGKVGRRLFRNDGGTSVLKDVWEESMSLFPASIRRTRVR